MTPTPTWLDDFFGDGGGADGANVGGEAEVFKAKVGTNLQMRTIKGGRNVSVTQNTNDIQLDASGGADGKTVRAMANTNQTLVDDDIANSIVQATGVLTERRKLTFPNPSGAGTSYQRVVQNSCTGHPIDVGTGSGRTVAVPIGCTSIIAFDENGAKELAGKHIDPRDFGCPWNNDDGDGDDDLPGWEAMLASLPLNHATPVTVQLPRGCGYFSGNMRNSRPLNIVGAGAGYLGSLPAEIETGIEFAPLMGVVQESSYTQEEYPDGIGTDGSRISDVMLFSTKAIVSKSTLGMGHDQKFLDPAFDSRIIGRNYAKGRVVIASGYEGDTYVDGNGTAEGATRVGPTVMFRVSNAGGITSGSEPAGFATATVADIGTTITDGVIEWTVESIPKDYVNDHSYFVGERVFVPGDNQAYFECEVAGTSMSAGAPTYALYGIGLLVPDDMVAPAYGQLIPDGPDTLVWRAHFPSGIHTLSNSCVVERTVLKGFTGYAINITSTLANPPYASTFGFADFCTTKDCVVSMCGGGIRYNGSDSNGGTDENINFLWLGLGRTNVDAAEYLNLGTSPGVFGTGGNAVLDRALGGALHTNHYVQFCQAAPYRNDTLVGSGSGGRWERCEAETSQPCIFVDYPVVICTGPLAEFGGGIVIGPFGRNLQERDVTATHTSTAYAKISNTVGGVWGFHATEDLNNEWGFKYATGYWKMAYSGPLPTTAFTLSSFGAGSNPGAGWVTFPGGYFLGDDNSTSIFRGRLDNYSAATGGLLWLFLRGGLRRAGDTFDSPHKKVTITGDGYRGSPWSALLGSVSPGGEALAIPPYAYEPTANGAWPVGGLKVFVCDETSTGTTTDALEPDWSTATMPGDLVEEDGGIVWRLVGFTPDLIVTRGPGGGQCTVDVSGGDVTLSDAQADCEIINPDGATVGQNVVFPTPEGNFASYQRTIRNTCTAAGDITCKLASGATVVVAAGKTAIVGFDASGAFRVTGDV